MEINYSFFSIILCVKTNQTFPGMVQFSHLVLPQSKEQTLKFIHTYYFDSGLNLIPFTLPSEKRFTVTPEFSSASLLVFIKMGFLQCSRKFCDILSMAMKTLCRAGSGYCGSCVSVATWVVLQGGPQVDGNGSLPMNNTLMSSLPITVELTLCAKGNRIE